MTSEVLAVVRHQAFENIVLRAPINWRMDPFESKSWQHHFMSLRWISPTALGDENLLLILRSFYNFHCVKQLHNPYYSDLRGDHTASIRVMHLLKLKQHFVAQEDIPGAGICTRLILKDIENLQSPRMYRAGHNHGLMVDIALLELYKSDPRYQNKINVERILTRGTDTLKQMFDADGVTREHSISYQEHNYPLARDFQRHYEALQGRPLSYASNISTVTKRLLSFAQRDCGEFFPIGDSFRQPNCAITSARPEIAITPGELDLIGQAGNRVMCAGGMFFYKRKRSPGSDFHFAATCTWQSHNHKQDDELSFMLEADGNLIFDDPGYTVYKNSFDRQLRDSEAHSTITIQGHPFGTCTAPPSGSGILSWNETSNGFNLSLRHTRVSGYILARSFQLEGDHLKIIDEISSPEKIFSARHSFVLNPSMRASVDGRAVHVFSAGKKIAVLEVHSNSGVWSIEDQLYIGLDRFKYLTTQKLVFAQNNESAILFTLDI